MHPRSGFLPFCRCDSSEWSVLKNVNWSIQSQWWGPCFMRGRKTAVAASPKLGPNPTWMGPHRNSVIAASHHCCSVAFVSFQRGHCLPLVSDCDPFWNAFFKSSPLLKTKFFVHQAGNQACYHLHYVQLGPFFPLNKVVGSETICICWGL